LLRNTGCRTDSSAPEETPLPEGCARATNTVHSTDLVRGISQTPHAVRLLGSPSASANTAVVLAFSLATDWADLLKSSASLMVPFRTRTASSRRTATPSTSPFRHRLRVFGFGGLIAFAPRR